jgi:hypothetical protein
MAKFKLGAGEPVKKVEQAQSDNKVKVIIKEVEKPVEVIKEVIKEIPKIVYRDRVVEKPVEVIKEVEKRVEVPIIKHAIRNVEIPRIKIENKVPSWCKALLLAQAMLIAALLLN